MNIAEIKNELLVRFCFGVEEDPLGDDYHSHAFGRLLAQVVLGKEEHFERREFLVQLILEYYLKASGDKGDRNDRDDGRPDAEVCEKVYRYGRGDRYKCCYSVEHAVSLMIRIGKW